MVNEMLCHLIMSVLQSLLRYSIYLSIILDPWLPFPEIHSRWIKCEETKTNHLVISISKFPKWKGKEQFHFSKLAYTAPELLEFFLLKIFLVNISIFQSLNITSWTHVKKVKVGKVPDENTDTYLISPGVYFYFIF